MLLFNSFISFLILLIQHVLSFNIDSRNNIAVYWGQNSEGNQQRLSEYCQSSDANIFILSFLNIFPDPMELNFANACSDTFSNNPNLLHCTEIASDIETCQSLGRKILLSLGGSSGSYGFTTDEEAESFAQTLWNTFGEGSDSTSVDRPFDSALIDGFDFDIENNNPIGYSALVNKLRELFKEGSKPYYISAAPQCPYPDASVGELLTNSEVDFAFIQFYNNYCSVDKQFNWNEWENYATTLSPNPNIKLFLGLPGSPTAASSGFISSLNLLKETIDSIKGSANFGGVSIWDASQAFTYEIDGKNYIENIETLLNGEFSSSISSFSSSGSSSSAFSTASSPTISFLASSFSLTSSSSTPSTASSSTISSFASSSSFTSSSTTSSPAFSSTSSFAISSISTSSSSEVAFTFSLVMFSSTSIMLSFSDIRSTSTLAPVATTVSKTTTTSKYGISSSPLSNRKTTTLLPISVSVSTFSSTITMSTASTASTIVSTDNSVSSIISHIIVAPTSTEQLSSTLTVSNGSGTTSISTPLPVSIASFQPNDVSPNVGTTTIPSSIIPFISTFGETTSTLIPTTPTIIATTITDDSTSTETSSFQRITSTLYPVSVSLSTSVSTTTTASTTVSTSVTPTPSNTVHKRAQKLNKLYSEGKYNGESTCTDGELACSSDGRFAVCNFGSWVTMECASGTTCYAYDQDGQVFTQCGFTNLKQNFI